MRAIELDARLAETLALRLGEPAGLEVWHADALHDDLAELTRDGPWQVVGNLPYAVATPIIRRLLRRGPAIPRIVVMVQREVAERFLAPPGSAQRGLVSVERELYASAQRLIEVPPAAFAPPPMVVSTVILLEPHHPPAPPVVLETALRLAAAAFTQRRKKLHNSLAGVAPPSELRRALAAANCDATRRPQEVETSAWLRLAQALGGPGEGEEA